jgi:MFS transporter, PAT family, beta-lactamase induction signal transducer AmpG
VNGTRSTAPAAFFVLALPFGISAGFTNVTLPFVLTRAGFSVAAAAAIVAVGISSNIWRFIWGPVADVTLTLRRWYLIGLFACAGSLFLVSTMPLNPHAAGILTVAVFLSQVAATFVMLPLGGLMAHTVADEQKGRAAGWFQAGNLGGMGAGGGVGVWLATHVSTAAAGAVLALAMIACASALVFATDVRPLTHEPIGHRMRGVGRDFLALVRSPIALLVMVLVMSPIGAGGAINLWSAVAPDWRASPDTVALVTGVLSGVASVTGCVACGWICDRIGRWWAFFGSGAMMAAVAIGMAMSSRTPFVYISGVLLYAVSTGGTYAAFSALLLYAIGRGAASTKYATLSSLGNFPTAYMTAFDGWMHDRSGAAGMLNGEAALGLGCIALGLAALGALNRAAKPARRDAISQSV